MRNIKYSDKFQKQYKKLDEVLKRKVKLIISSLSEDKFYNNLKVHKLNGKLRNYYSCSIDYSNRIIFEIENWWDILLLLVWDHDVYKIN